MILITGASGRIARRAAELLHARGLPLRLMSRSPDRCPRFAATEVFCGDFADSASLLKPFQGISAALIISGMAAPGERARRHRNAFRAAAKAGVEHIIYLSLRGASPLSLFPYCIDHFTSEAFLAEVQVPFTALRVGYYMDMFFQQVAADGALFGPPGEARGAFLSREDAAQAAAEAVVRRPGGKPEISGPELLSFEDVARELSCATARNIFYNPETYGEMRVRLERAGLPEWAQNLEISWWKSVAAGEQAPLTDGFRKLVGHGPMTLHEYLAAFPALTNELKQRH